MNQPTFFLSSTIYDFADLRSAIKYYLEEQGAKVLASEFNDFNKPLNKHSYKACLEVIKQANYFVLFIGARVGGWYNSIKRISITQREYREAYKLHKKGKLTLIIFVREEIWQFKECRNDLVRYLKKCDLQTSLKKEIENHPSKTVEDASFIIQFLNEVGRNRETIEALRENGELPTANWIHTFKTFDQIVDVLRTQIFSGYPQDQSLMRDLLCAELRNELKSMLVKIDHGKVYSPKYNVLALHNEHEFTMEVRSQHFFQINAERWDIISSLYISINGKKIQTKLLDHVLLTNTFLRFSVADGRYRNTEVYDALQHLQNEIGMFNKANVPEINEIVFDYTPRRREQETEYIGVETDRLWGFLHLLDRWVNVIELMKAIIRYLDGDDFIYPELRPFSPIRNFQQEIEREKVNDDELDEIIYQNARY